MSFVSVIIPVYNSEKWIAATLESCLCQVSYLKEIIAIDDQSTDGSWEILEQYASRHSNIIHVYKNIIKGGNAARSYGFTLSTGSFIQWLDADDVIITGKLKAQVEFLKQHEHIDIAYSDWTLNTHHDGKLIRSESKESRQYDDYLNELLVNNWLPPHAYLLKRPIAQISVDRLWWNPQTRIAQDREYFTQCALWGAKFGYVAGNFCIYNRDLSASSVSRSLTFPQRAKNMVRLLGSFLLELDVKDWISENQKKKYKQILMTEIVYYAALYHVPLERPVSPNVVKWSLIKGWRSRLKVARFLFLKR